MGLAPAVPVWMKLKMPLDPYCKKPRFSMMTLKVPAPGDRLTADFLVLFI